MSRPRRLAFLDRAPRYAKPRVASELRALVAEIEGRPVDERATLRGLLEDVRR
jgi:hypothetical protein